jgi:hypothetical protein
MMKIIMMIGFVVVLGIVMTRFVLQREHSTYHPEQVERVREGIYDYGIVLTFRPPNESEFFCPGVICKRQGYRIQYTYVRSPIGVEAPVDIKARQNEDGSLSVTFPFPDNKWEKGDRIELIDSTGRSHGHWENPGNVDK